MRKPTKPACPICGKPSEKDHFPFCSPRCRRVDLGRWLGESYRVPVADDEEAEAVAETGKDQGDKA